MPKGAKRHGVADQAPPSQDAGRRRVAGPPVRGHLATILAAVPDLWFVIDAEGCYREVSDPQHPHLISPWEEVVGRPFGALVSSEHAVLALQAHERARETGKVQSIEYGIDIGGDRRRFEARIAPMPRGQWLYLTHDLGDRHVGQWALAEQRDHLEQLVAARTAQLAAALAAAEAASQAKSQFLSRMSHELRTPMNAVLGFAQLLGRDESVPQRARDQIGHILRAGHHLLGLINDVLNLSHVESGHLSIATEPVPLDELVDEAVALMLPRARQLGVTIEVAPMGGLQVRADRMRLRQVLLNLVSNAVKYNRPGGRVELQAVRQGADMALVVEDTGTGLTPAQLERLFDPFDRLGAERGPIEGTGIGLTISRRLIELMQGQIEAESEPGVGTRMRLVLPALPGPDPVAVIAAESREGGMPPASGHRCVLYVDGKPTNQRRVRHLIERHAGIGLLSARTGRRGLALARKERPGLVLLGLNLPDLDAPEVLAQLRADAATRDLAVVAVTAQTLPAQQGRLRRLGFVGCLAQPVDVSAFDALVSRWLGGVRDAPEAMPPSPAKRRG